MVSSCRGLSLFFGLPARNFLYVGNPVTMQYKGLPFPSAATDFIPSCHIVFIPHTGDYKVVCHCVNLSGVHAWFLLTVGNNMSWRKLEMSLTRLNLVYGERTSVTAGGVIYWTRCSNDVFAIDLHDETTHFIQVPNEFVERSYGLLELGNSLSCVVNHQAEVHVCVLKDLHSSEWGKLYKLRVAIDGQKFSCQTFVPVGWLDDGRILVFIIQKLGDWKGKLVVAHNVKTGETRTFNDFSSQFIQKHTNSLVSW